jgi:ParB family chromosome partitioning protein
LRSSLQLRRKGGNVTGPSAARRGLGRGLEVLIGGAEAGPTQLAELPVDAVYANPRQPRRRFEPEATSGLASSIKQQGLLQPIVVRPRQAGGYELIAGERRWRAAREAGLETLPALVRDADDRDSLLLALVENVAREQLSPVEEARAYASLVDEFELSLGEVADRVGRSKPSVSNRLRLLELPEEVLWMVARGELTEGHARAVLAVPDHDARKKLAKRIVRDGMSVRAAEKAAQDGGAARKPRAATKIDPALAERARGAAERLTGLPVRVSAGKLEIHFGEELRLEELVEVLESL